MKTETKKAQKAREILERAEAKKSMFQQRLDMINNTPIAKAVEPLKADAITRAEKDARDYIVKLTAILAKHDNNLTAVAPEPGYNIGREQYQTMALRRNLFLSFTEARGERLSYHARKAGEAEFRDVCPAAVERFVENAKIAAAEHYESFVGKLVGKVGAHDAATLEGNHVWGYSFLTVTLPKGEKQVWKTQQIVNCSVYGLLFNQWPSRQVKGGAV